MTVEQAKTDFFNNKDAVIQELIKHVMFVDCEIPRTLKKILFNSRETSERLFRIEMISVFVSAIYP